MNGQPEPASRTFAKERSLGQSSQQAIWADIVPYLTSWPGTLEALARSLPRFVDADRIDVYLMDGDRILSSVVSRHTDGNAPAGGQTRPLNAGVCGSVVQTGRSYNVPDVAQEPRCTDVERERGGALLVVPLRTLGGEVPEAESPKAGSPSSEAPRNWEPLESGEHVLGVLCAARDRVGAFSAEEAEQIEAIACQVATLLDFAQQYKCLQESARESQERADRQTQNLRVECDRADFLYHVAEETTRTLDLDRVLNRTLARVGQAIGVRQASVLLLDPVSGYLDYRAALGRPVHLPQGGKRTRYKRGVGLGGWVLQHNQWTIVTCLEKDPRWVTDADQQGENQSALALPLSSEGEAIGVLLFFHPEPNYFSEHHVGLAIAAANHISVAVKNAEMYRLIREQAERLGGMLREQRRIASQHAAILSSIADGLVVADEWGKVVVANDAALRLLGVSSAKRVGQQALELFSGCPRDARQAARQAMLEVTEGAQGAQLDDSASATLTCEGRIVKASFTPMLDDRRQFAGTVIVLRDITAEQELIQAKSEFVSIVSHELRTPMTSIKGYTDLLLKGTVGSLSEQQVRFLSTVKANVDRMAELVQDLLDISRIEAGRLRLTVEALDLRQVMYEISDTVAEAVREHELTLEVDIDPRLPVVHADRNRIIQVLLNLVSNAYRYTPAGGKITVSAFPIDGAVQVDVTDTGIGIPQDEQEMIFERFYRADHPQVRQQAGTGLGLPIARSLIELHGGKLWLKSQVDQGSTFSFTLPLTEAS